MTEGNIYDELGIDKDLGMKDPEGFMELLKIEGDMLISIMDSNVTHSGIEEQLKTEAIKDTGAKKRVDETFKPTLDELYLEDESEMSASETWHLAQLLRKLAKDLEISAYQKLSGLGIAVSDIRRHDRKLAQHHYSRLREGYELMRTMRMQFDDTLKIAPMVARSGNYGNSVVSVFEIEGKEYLNPEFVINYFELENIRTMSQLMEALEGNEEVTISSRMI